MISVSPMVANFTDQYKSDFDALLAHRTSIITDLLSLSYQKLIVFI